MIDMFSSSAFNQPLDHFETSKVKAMTYMFVNGESPTSVSLRFRDKRNPQFKKSSISQSFQPRHFNVAVGRNRIYGGNVSKCK